MGAYVNSPTMTKETWLAENAIAVQKDEFTWEDTPEDSLPVVLGNNGPFTAACICYSDLEFQAFMDPNDRRPKRFFYALETDLHTVSPRLAEYIERARG